MEYTINNLAKISGVTTRTLRYYDEIGILKPSRISSNSYRIYGKGEVDTLQQILFYRELGFELLEIKRIINTDNFEREKALREHLSAIIERKNQIEKLINNIENTIKEIRGEVVMNDNEKFEGFKHNIIEENEQKFGREIRNKYGDSSIDISNANIAKMSEKEWKTQEELERNIACLLIECVKSGDPKNDLSFKLCTAHKEWICMFWGEGAYTKEAHKGLGEMYVADERFKAYYDKICDNGAQFLCDALNNYCK